MGKIMLALQAILAGIDVARGQTMSRNISGDCPAQGAPSQQSVASKELPPLAHQFWMDIVSESPQRVENLLAHRFLQLRINGEDP